MNLLTNRTIMRKLLMMMLIAIMGSFTVTAQDMKPKKAFRTAKRSLRAFENDNEKVDKLDESVDLIMLAAKDSDMKEDPKVWNLMGDIYSAYLELDYKNSLLDENYKPQRSEEHTSELQSRGHLVCRL